MKRKHRKFLISGTAVVAAGALGIGTLIQTSLSVQASVEMMPGIETIVDENSSEKPFRILELVSNSEDAELGYYVSGQEPSVKLYTWQYQDSNGQLQTMHFSSLAEGLQKLPTAKLRQEFAMNVRLNADGEIDTSASTGIRSVSDLTGDNIPVSYSEYQEKYFLSSSDDVDQWKEIDFTDPSGKNTRTDKVQVKGEYQENTAHTGDYTREEQEYYPIKGSPVDDSKEKYRENIQNFYFSESDENSRGAYDLYFETVTNETVNKNLKAGAGNTLSKEYDPDKGFFGLYENVYEDLTSVMAENIKKHIYTFPGEDTAKESLRKLYENLQSPISQVADFSSGDIGDSADTSADTESTPVELGSDSSSQSPASSEPDNGDSVSFDNGFADSTGDISSDDSVDEWNDTDSEIESEAMGAGDHFGSDFSDTDSGVTDSYDESGIDDNTSDASDFTESADDNADVGESVDAEMTTADEPVGDPLLTESVKKVQEVDTNTETNTTPETVGDNPGKQENPYVYVSKQINVFPYYKYTKLGTFSYVMAKQQMVAQRDKAAQDSGESITRQNGDIVLENDQYYYYKVDDAGTNKYLLTLVTGRQPVAYQDIQQIPENLGYDYYYRVNGVYFCCTDGDSIDENNNYKFTGWYYVNYQDQSNIYVQAENLKVATYYVSDASYTLTPGTGDFDFVPYDNADSQSVQVNHMYYNGGLTNNDWFKKFVFHLQPKADASAEDGEFENFNIQVDTMSADSSGDSLQAVYASAGTDTSADVAGQEDDSEDTQDISVDTDEENIEEEAVADEQSDDFTDSVDMAPVEDAGEATDSGTTSEEDSDAQSEIDVEEDSIDEAGDAETTETSADPLQTALEGYDLIYVNGTLSTDMAAALEGAVSSNTLPCIINNARDGAANSLSEKMKADFVKADTEDADGHYVNKYVYFFKNTFVNETADNDKLLNSNFNTNFNDDLKSEDNKTYDTSHKMHGFEEIIKYINSENQYRGLGDDGNVNEQEIKQLNREISQARAIEYIINYKYKRAEKIKENIKALEIMPDANCSKLDENMIRSWLGEECGPEIETITANCEHTGEEASKAIDGNKNTMWHTKWKNESGCVNVHNEHYLTVTFKKETGVSGFHYLGRQRGGATGTLTEYTVELYDKDNKSLGKEIGKTGITLENYSRIGNVELKFSKKYQSVKNVKVIFNQTLGNSDGTPANRFASCAEISFYNELDNTITPSITHMTASEFVGHIDDITSEYDLIYISDKLLPESSTLITGNGDYRYVHVGDGVSASSGAPNLLKLLGQLEIEYDHMADGSRWSQKGYWTNNNTQNPIWTASTSGNVTINRFAPLNTYGQSGGGFFRGSGNDMTKQQYNELMDFVKSGYPVVIGSELTTSDRTANSKKVDNSSWYYQFINDAFKYNNVVTDTELDNESKDIKFFLNLAKPQIIFEKDGKPKEAPRQNVNDESGEYAYLNNNELKYTFTIQNDSDVFPANSTYDCKLYIDLNFDGNLSSKEIQDQYVEITDEDGAVIARGVNDDGTQRYELKAGKRYTLVRKIPSDYYKLITWKLVVSSNRNSYIHTSEMGYSKQQNTGSKQQIHVLQLMQPSAYVNKPTLDLAKNSVFQNKIKNLDDFEIKIDQVQISELKNYTREQMKDLLDQEQMLVLGFADVYQDIPNNNGQVEEILNFVKKGKSIIFAHDTTSYVNYDRDNVYHKIASTEYGKDENTARAYDRYLEVDTKNPTWGLSLNKILRSVVGLDRYGITSTEVLKNGTVVGNLISQGRALTSDSVSFSELMSITGDIAYQNDSAQSSSYAQTQAYSNNMIVQDSPKVTKAAKINDGAITQYPYVMDDNIEIAETHGQYYQLAMEQDRDINGNSDGQNDVVVWYCLRGDYYDKSPNDVRNNYYFYSKGNVIYTGAGHSTVNNEKEIELFINAMVAAANVTAVRPEVDFISSLNPAAEKEQIRYYMTDQSNWTANETNTLEQNMDFYINVKDYNMVSADLNQADLDKKEMTIEFFIEGDGGSIQTDSGSDKKLVNITNQINNLKGYNGETVTLGNDGRFHTKNNNAFGFTINNIEQYLKKQNAYKENCRLYVRVSSTVYLYGEDKTNTVWASIDLKHRQLFDLD